MLEVARVLGAADCLTGEQKHTVIFVAIDKEVSILSGVHQNASALSCDLFLPPSLLCMLHK